MNGLVYHIVSGQAFFTGISLIIVAIVCAELDKRLARHFTGISLILGTLLVVTSSTAIPYWLYAVSLVATIAWVISRFVSGWKRWAPAVAAGTWMIAAVVEIPYHVTLDSSVIAIHHCHR